MNVVRTLIILLGLSFVWASSISIGSELDSSPSCSKFHFEEKVLEKLVRLEHKMQILEEKMGAREKLNTAKMDEINNIKKQTEAFVQLVHDAQIQDQMRFNKSHQEIVEHFKTQATNENNDYGNQMNTLLGSLSSLMEVFTEAEKKMESVSELVKHSLDRELLTFNSSFVQIVENLQVNKLQEIIVNQHKEFTEMIVNKTVAFSAYLSRSEELKDGEKVIFDGVWTNVGNGYEPSTGIFKAPHAGLYHITAVMTSIEDANKGLFLCHNGLQVTRSIPSGKGFRTGTFDVVFDLQKGDTVYIDSLGDYTIYSDEENYMTFSGYMIA